LFNDCFIYFGIEEVDNQHHGKKGGLVLLKILLGNEGLFNDCFIYFGIEEVDNQHHGKKWGLVLLKNWY
jgi:hypothetical protein